ELSGHSIFDSIKFYIQMKKHIYSLLVLMAVLLNQDTQAQQDPQYTQYMYNMNVHNPAYAGSKESLSLTALYRTQWSGMEGNPVTFTFLHIRLSVRKSGWDFRQLRMNWALLAKQTCLQIFHTPFHWAAPPNLHWA